MHKLHRQTNLTAVMKDNEIKDVIIPVAVDDVTSNDYFRDMQNSYPELSSKFNELYSGVILEPGKAYVVPADNDCRVILFVIKQIGKYGAALIDILDCWDDFDKKREEFLISKVVVPVFEYKTTKLLDNLSIPPMIDYCMFLNLEIHIVDETDKLKYLIEAVSEEPSGLIISWKQNPLKEVKFFTKDDILLMIVIHDMFTRLPKYRLTKSGLIRMYKIFKDNGHYPELTFYKTEYGDFFREFMMKMNFMVNHGLLHNLLRGSDPGKMALCIGHSFPNFVEMSKDIVKSLHKPRVKMFRVMEKQHLGSLARQKKFLDSKGGGGGKGNWQKKNQQRPPQPQQKPAENLFNDFD